MTKMSQGSLSVAVKGNYKGKYAELGDSVNLLIKNIGAVISEASNVLSRIAQGDLNIDEVQMFHGDYASMSDSLTTIIHSLNRTLGSINDAAEQVDFGAKQVNYIILLL